ncbi:MAG: 50S ribosome-binding GTPase [Proteobacteria bacterium]|nr:50S ribosome-binding GTPase [Pseudomonadota bacterium]
MLNKKMTLEEAEKLHTVIKSETINSETASQLLGLDKSQSQEKLYMMFQELLKTLHSARGRVESAVDFPEAEEEQAQDVKSATLVLEKFYSKTTEMMSAYELFRSKASEPLLALVGETNAGKSTLFNILCGAKRSIVSSVAGTTRDYVEARIHTGLRWIRIVDTAGLRSLKMNNQHDEIEKEGIELSHELINKAQLVVWVQNASISSGEAFINLLKEKNHITIFSHKDLSKKTGSNVFDFIKDSAELRENIFLEINKKLEKQEASIETGLWLSDRQAKILELSHKKAKETLFLLKEGRSLDLVAENLQECERLIKQCVGQDMDESYIGEIFSQFCLGK